MSDLPLVINRLLNNALISRTLDDYGHLKEKIPQFLVILKAYLSGQEISQSDSFKTSMLFTIRDMISASLDTSLGHSGRFIFANFLKELQNTLHFLELAITNVLEKLQRSVNEIFDKKSLELSSTSGKIEALQREIFLLAQCLFQYCNAVDLNTQEVSVIINGYLKKSDITLSSTLVAFGLLSFVERCRIDILRELNEGNWVNRRMKAAIQIGCFSFYSMESQTISVIENESAFDVYLEQTKKISLLVTQEKDEFYKFVLQTIENVFVRLLLNLPRTIKRLRNKEEEDYLAGKPTKFRSFDQLLEILSIIYENRENSALLFLEADAKLHPFLKWSCESKISSTIARVINFIAAISCGSKAVKYSFDLICAGNLGIIAWDPLFDALDKYVDALSDPRYSGDINPEEYEVLLSFLGLVKVVASQIGDARSYLFQPKIINTLISLLCCKIPVDFKAKILEVLAAFSIDSEKSSIIISFLQKSQVLIGILGEIQQIEYKQESYTETLAFLDLAVALSKQDSSITSLVFEKVYSTILQRGYRVSREKWLIGGKCLELFVNVCEKDDYIREKFCSNSYNCVDILLELLNKQNYSYSSSANVKDITDICNISGVNESACVDIADNSENNFSGASMPVGFDSYRCCSFYGMKLIWMLIKKDARFIDSLFARNGKLMRIFDLLIEENISSNVNVLFYLVKIIGFICCYGYLPKLSKLLLDVNGNSSSIFLGMVNVMNCEGNKNDTGDIESHQLPEFPFTEIDYFYTVKLNLIELIEQFVCQGDPSLNLFAALIKNSSSFNRSLVSTVKSSPYVEMVEKSLLLIVAVLKNSSKNFVEDFLRYLRNTENFFSFILTVFETFSTGKFSSKSLSCMCRIIGIDLYYLYARNLSTSRILSQLSYRNLLLMLKKEVIGAEEFPNNHSQFLENFEFLVSILVGCCCGDIDDAIFKQNAFTSIQKSADSAYSTAENQELEGFLSSELFSTIIEIIPTIANIYSIQNLSHCLFLISQYFIKEESLQKIIYLLSFNWDKFTAQSRIALYSSIISRNDTLKIKNINGMVINDVLIKGLCEDIFSEGTLQFTSLAAMEFLVDKEENVSRYFCQHGYLFQLIKKLFESQDSILIQSIISLLGTISCSFDLYTSNEMLVDSGFLEALLLHNNKFYPFTSASAITSSTMGAITLRDDSIALLMGLVRNCFFHVPKCSPKIKQFHTAFENSIKDSLNVFTNHSNYIGMIGVINVLASMCRKEPSLASAYQPLLSKVFSVALSTVITTPIEENTTSPLMSFNSNPNRGLVIANASANANTSELLLDAVFAYQEIIFVC